MVFARWGIKVREPYGVGELWIKRRKLCAPSRRHFVEFRQHIWRGILDEISSDDFSAIFVPRTSRSVATQRRSKALAAIIQGKTKKVVPIAQGSKPPRHRDRIGIGAAKAPTPTVTACRTANGRLRGMPSRVSRIERRL